MSTQQVVRAATPASQGGGRPDGCTLTPAMAERAAGRLCWVTMACALTAAASFSIHYILQPETRVVQNDPIYSLTFVSLFLVAAALVTAQRLKLLAPMYILAMGLFFEVLVAWCIGYAETFLPMDPDTIVRGGSLVAVWLAFVTMLVRHTPVVTLGVAFVAASMWPAAYFFNVWQHGYEALPWSRLGMWFFAPYMTVVWAYFLNKRIFRIEMQAQRAEELGSYKLSYLIGEGGMGEVWRARHRLLARDAAIKIIKGYLSGRNSIRQSEILRRRFEREAKATASLECPHTVYIFDFGTTKQGAFYYVMELLNGVSFQTLVDRFGPLPAGRAVSLIRQVALSLEEAHERGLIHRDIKPSNLFACKLGLQCDFVKVLDFGLVKHTDPSQSTLLTQDGSSAGTPAYMAPEAALGEEKVDGRLDLYSLGCVAYFLLTGRLVFEEANATAIAVAHVQKEPVAPSLRTELAIPPGLDEVILKCLAKKPEDRPASAIELIRMLDGVEGLEPWTAEAAEAWWRKHLPENTAAVAPHPSNGSGETLGVE